MAEPILELRGVSMDFPQPRGGTRRVLEGIDVAIYPEEVVALLGPSGSGKSTILRILAGLTKATRGEVRYRGTPTTGINPQIGFVFQSFALFPWMTVQENIEAALVARGTSPEETKARAERVIRLVGLAGSEEAYPRELSGGMKQRVGMARALSLEPELLFMDEPFSQVDALTAESLRAEVLDIWAVKERNPRSILMVSHDIKEVAYMADRVVVLDANPGRVRTVIRNDLPRPRDYRSAGLQLMVDRLHDIITGMEMPDVPAPAAVTFEPIPDAGAGEVIGLLEYLDARGGREDVFRIAAETDREFGALINVVNAAELLDFVTTPKRTVVLAPLGEKFVRASLVDRKAIWRDQILELRLFQQVRDAIERNERKRTTKEFVLETIAVMMPQEDYEKVFQRLVGWARYGDLFAYDDDTETLTLQETVAVE
ncbi:MAG TPA: nitrate/sulfonate/bicarbonate ABC transporter ATP-binding protein [Anaeromyxobacter sp.]|nr:nitrate/sulfonate/bicarbonate ABC transporter ATP-binding protein [Anaeromyxobacter sp.]